MRISFAKPFNDDRPATLTVVRDDGSTTGQASSAFFVAHDLTHFAVETTLEYRDAFFGLLAKGWDIDTFAEREPGSTKVRTLPGEAKLAETIVGALDLQRRHVFREPPEVREFVTTECENHGRVDPELSDENIVAMCALRDELIARWKALEPGATLELDF